MKKSILRNIKLTCSIFILLLCGLLFSNSQIILNASEKTEIDEAYYRVENKLINTELQYGLMYEKDEAYTAVTDQNSIIGYACGSEFYGSTPFVVNKEYSQSAHVLTIPSDSELQIVSWSVVNNGRWTLSSILKTASDYELHHPGYKVIAGINGDFFDINANNNYPYTVSGMMASDGNILRVNQSWQALKLNNEEENKPLLKVDNPTVTSKPVLNIYNSNDEIIYSKQLDLVNDDNLAEGQTGLYFGQYYIESSSHLCASRDVSEAFIISASDKQVAYSNESFYGLGKISSYGSATLTENQFAIKTKDAEVLNYLSVGTTIRVQYDFTNELEGAQEVCGVVCTFLKDGKLYKEDRNYNYMEYRYPRTLIGYTASGDVVMAVTDGRQESKGYYGLNGVESAAQMLHYNCVEAYSFDGGGSTTMVILQDGELKAVNSPSDGNLRNDGNAVLIVAKESDVDVSAKVNETSIEFTVNVVELSEKYRDLYIECNGIKKHLNTKTVTFDDLTIYTDYVYQIYAYINEKYVLLPFGGKITTSKTKFQFENMILTLIENEDEKYYEISLELNDPHESLVSIAIYVNGKRLSTKNGKYIIDYEFGSPATCDGTVLTIYELNSVDGRINETVKLLNLRFNDAKTALSSIVQGIDFQFDEIFK